MVSVEVGTGCGLLVKVKVVFVGSRQEQVSVDHRGQRV